MSAARGEGGAPEGTWGGNSGGGGGGQFWSGKKMVRQKNRIKKTDRTNIIATNFV